MTNPRSAQEILIDWANSQTNWVRAVVSEALSTRDTLPEQSLDRIYALSLAERELSGESVEEIPKLTAGSPTNNNGGTLVLTSLSDVRNVNVLALGQEVLFNPTMTVLFGENATGKSGYVRILKRLAAVRSVEEVLPDISVAGARPKPHARLGYRLGDTEDSIDWDDEAGVPPFTRISVFDTRAVSFHVDDDLNYRYTPRDLALFEIAHEALRAVRERLENSRDAKLRPENPFLSRFQPGSTVYAKIETIGPTTDLDEIEILAAVASEEESELLVIRDKVDALAPHALNSQLEVALSEKALAEATLQTSRAVGSFDWPGHNERVSSRIEADGNYRRATETAFSGEDILSALSNEWRDFIEAGEAYIQHIDHQQYPRAGDRCIYCRQDLSELALALVQKYRDFANSTFRVQLDGAISALETGSEIFADLDVDALRTEASRKIEAAEGQDTPHELAQKAIEFADVITPALETIGAGLQPIDPAPLLHLAHDAEAVASSVDDQATKLIEDLNKRSAEREAEQEKARRKLRDLEDRITLRALLPSIRAHVEDIKWASRASTAIDRFPPLLRSLTDASKLASEDLINQDFESHFTEECKSLRAPEVNLEFPGREGAASRRKSLTTEHKLSEILAEGEQKAIALADFLAEASIRKDSAPFVFDDPVNSLDYRRLEYIVDRLVALSGDHQVVVFTHNIWFAASLLEKFADASETDRCYYYDVSETPSGTGVVTRGSHPRWDTQRKTRARVNELIQTARPESGELQQALIEKAYESIRNWCEVVVEQELFKSVTQRYQPHVRMTMLARIKYDALQTAAGETLALFEKACRVIEGHSQPLETLNIRPTLEELEQDWRLAQTSLKNYMDA